MNASVLVDLGALSCGCTDHALEDLHKALAEDVAGDIWRPHESIFLRELVEQITGRGARQLAGLSSALDAWLHAHGGKVAPAATDVWASETFRYLAGKPVAKWSAEDFGLLVDYLAREHFPPEFLREMSDALAKHAALMGRVQAAHQAMTEAQVAEFLAKMALPGAIQHALDVAAIDANVLRYGAVACADRVEGFADAVRHRLKAVILDHERVKRIEGREPQALQTRLFDEFGQYNRDWRRIAVTEAGEMANQGYIASMRAGDKLQRVEMYQGACAFCRKIDGQVVTVVAPTKADKNWDTEIWLGKTNAGRSASPYKRVGGQLVKRAASEMWAIPAGLAHPHCRGRWVKLSGSAEPDPFTAWLFSPAVLGPQKAAAGA